MELRSSWLMILYALLLWLLPFHVPSAKGMPFFNFSIKTKYPTGYLGMESKIGSRPPRCEAKCGSCIPCYGIQVPVNRAAQRSKTRVAVNPITGSRGGVHRAIDDYIDYKPMTWKCKCRDKLFNP